MPIIAGAVNCDKMDTDQDHKASALLKAFTAVLDCIGQKKVVLLSSLHLHYIQELEKMALPIQSTEAQLENHNIHKLIAFTKVNPGDKGCISYNLVYSASIFIADVVA